MGYKIDKPCTDKQRIDFIFQYNHIQSLEIVEKENAFYAIYPWEIIDGDNIIDNTEAWQQQQVQKENERIAKLNMTRGDFIEGLILAQGKDENDIIALIEMLPILDIDKKVYINRVKNALDFYRGYPVIDVLCEYLGVTTESMDSFFETKDYKYLIPVIEDTTDDDQLGGTTDDDQLGGTTDDDQLGGTTDSDIIVEDTIIDEPTESEPEPEE